MGYFKEVNQEMKRVTWPTFGEVNKYTWTVVAMIIFLGTYFGGVDVLLSNLMSFFFKLGR